MTLDGKILRRLFEHGRLKPANIRTNQENVQTLAQLRQIMNTGLKIALECNSQLSYHSKSPNINLNYSI